MSREGKRLPLTTLEAVMPLDIKGNLKGTKHSCLCKVGHRRLSSPSAT